MNSTADTAYSLAEKLGITERTVNDRLCDLGIDASCRAALAKLAPAFAKRSAKFTELLYKRFRAQGELAGFFASDARVKRFLGAQSTYLAQLVSDPLDWSYVTERLRLGAVHHHIHLTPPWFIATFSHYMSDHIDMIFACTQDRAEAVHVVDALFRSIMFDASLALHSYGYEVERDAIKQSGSRPTEPEDDATSYKGRDAANMRQAELSRLGLENETAAGRAAFTELGEEERRHLETLGPSVARVSPAVFEKFYAWMHDHPEMARLIPGASVYNLRDSIASYWIELVSSDFQMAYAARRKRIGIIYERIGLKPYFYLAGLARQVGGYLNAIEASELTPDTLRAFFKAIFFDISFFLDAYSDARVNTLMRAERHASKLVEKMPTAVVVLDEDGRIRSVNQALIDMLELQPDSLYHLPVGYALPLPGIGQFFKEYKEQKSDKTIIRFGTSHFRLAILDLDEWSDASLPGHAIIIDDVTKILGTAHAFQRIGAEFDTVVTSIRAILWEIDQQSGTLVSISQSVSDILGNIDTGMLGVKDAWLNSIHADDREVFRLICSEMKVGERREIEQRMIHADGHVIWTRTVLARPYEASNARTVFGLSVDITEQREAIVHSERLEGINQLAGTLSHDYNNALTVILLNLDIALENCSDPLVKECIARANIAAKMGAGLSRRMLNFSGQSTNNATIFAPNLRLRELEMLILRMIGQHITLETKYAPINWDVLGNESEFNSAIINLVFNAREAMPGGGKLMLKTQNILSSQNNDYDQMWISVIDTGIGMTPEIADRATEPYFSTKATGLNSGLGLTGVRHFAEQAGGKLLISSAAGKGTHITLIMRRVITEDRTQVREDDFVDLPLVNGKYGRSNPPGH